MAHNSRIGNRLIKLVISAVFWCGTSMLEHVRRLAGKCESRRCIVLYYHSVPVEHKGRFARQMDTVAALTKPINLDDARHLSRAGRYSAVTFDDAFENVIQYALPELRKRHIPATVFVAVDLIGRRATWWPDGTPEQKQMIATAEILKGVPVDLVTMGSHTLTHPRLSMLDSCGAEQEIRESKLRLEALLKREVRMFSLPYGDFNSSVIGLCRRAGYERVFTSLPFLAFQDESEFVTGRISVEPTDWDLEFRLKLAGAYRWLPYAISLKRMIVRRKRRPVRSIVSAADCSRD